MSELETHPCFTAKCSDYARIHLPVAPKCNMQCNYCLRKYSCVNESRPGVVARVMVPEDAVDWYLQIEGQGAEADGSRHCRPRRCAGQLGNGQQNAEHDS